MTKKKPVLSVVEELKGINLEDFIEKIYDPEFWYSYIPLRKKKIETIPESQEEIHKYTYEVEDTVYMDVTQTLKYDFSSNGKIEVIDKGNQGNKGHLWELDLDIEHPQSTISLNIRAKNVNQNLKVGFFIYRLDFDMGKLKDLPFGWDAIIFAGRMKLRELLKDFEKSFPK